MTPSKEDPGSSTGATRGTRPPERVRSGGRSAEIRRRVGDAVLEMLADDSEITVASVAARAGVHRSTVHRWWPTEADLIGQALSGHTSRIRDIDTGSFEGDLRSLARFLSELFSDPVEKAMNSALARGVPEDVRARTIDHWNQLLGDLTSMVDRGIARGELAPTADPAMAFHLLVAPLLVESTLLHRDPDPDWVERLADTVATAFRARPTDTD